MRKITVENSKLTLVFDLSVCKYCGLPMLDHYNGDAIKLSGWNELRPHNIQVETRDHYGVCRKCYSTNPDFQEHCDLCHRMVVMPDMVLKIHEYLPYDGGVDTAYLCKDCYTDGRKVVEFLDRENYKTCEVQRDGEWKSLF